MVKGGGGTKAPQWEWYHYHSSGPGKLRYILYCDIKGFKKGLVCGDRYILSRSTIFIFLGLIC